MESEPIQVLVAEDHNVSRMLLERSLIHWGYSVISVQNGEEALAVLKRDDPPPMAILDWMMPRMDGMEVCTRVREDTSRPYVYMLLLTARSDKKEIADGLRAGADDYVVKPFDHGELRARLTVGRRVVALERALEDKVRDLELALSDVRKLSRLLPICAYCKSVRDDRDYWHAIDEYVHKETGTDFSNGICPVCLDKKQAEELVWREALGVDAPTVVDAKSIPTFG